MDEFTWSISSNCGTLPEDFARTTRVDLGLPLEFEPLIAFKIREYIFRRIISILDRDYKAAGGDSVGNIIGSGTCSTSESSLVDVTRTNDGIISTTATTTTVAFPKVSLVSTQTAVENISALWRKFRPTSVQSTEVIVTVPYAILPSEKSSNAQIWR